MKWETVKNLRYFLNAVEWKREAIKNDERGGSK